MPDEWVPWTASQPLFAIEEDMGSEPEQHIMCRVDEHGGGTPLLWRSREAAEQVIKDISMETGCFGDMRVVEFSMAGRFPEPNYCSSCDKWGPLTDHIGHD